MPEQTFLAKNYDENSKKGDRDPRGAFRNPTDFAGAAGIVGPLGSSSFNLPHVERALTEMEAGIGGPGVSALDASTARRLAVRTSGAAGRPGLSALGPSITSPTSHGAGVGRSPSSPTSLAGSSSPTAGQTQHEVLQNFFQSLLSSKDRAGVNAASGRSGVPRTNGNTSGTE
jgi:dynein light intermediate chain 1